MKMQVFLETIVAVLFFLSLYFLASLFFVFLKSLLTSRLIQKEKNKISVFYPSVSIRELSRVDRFLMWYEEIPARNVKLVLKFLFLLVLVFLFLGEWLFFCFFLVIFMLFLLRIFKQVFKIRNLFIKQLPESLLSLLASLKAGFSIDQAFVVAERESELPVKKVYSTLIRARGLGMSLSEALTRITRDLNLQEWSMVSEVLQIQQRVGGNIIPIVEEVALVLREKIRLDQEVKTATASGRLTGVLLGLLAPISFVILYFTAPGYVEVLYLSDAGKLLLFVSAILEIIGFMLIWRIIKVEY